MAAHRLAARKMAGAGHACVYDRRRDVVHVDEFAAERMLHWEEMPCV